MQKDQETEADVEANETTSLIKNNNNDDDMGRSSSSTRPFHKEPEWPGQADFDGLPWYKTPSVRI